MHYLGKYNIADVVITACSYEYIINKIVSAAKNRHNLLVAPVATHPLALAGKDKKYQRLLNSFDLVLPDSQYIRLALRLRYGINLPTRIYGPALFKKTCEAVANHKLKILLYGNHTDKLVKVLRQIYPQLLFRAVDITSIKIRQREIDSLKRDINIYNPDVVVIGVGSPLQHNILGRLRDVSCPVIAVGAAFDFISGIKSQAPVWVGNLGLEWLYRLVQEPKRLWRRYLLGGLLFIRLIIKQKFKVVL